MTYSDVQNLHYMIIIDASLSYHNLKLDKNCHTYHICLSIGRHGFTRLPFGVAPAGDMFQQKIDEIFKDLPVVVGIANDILVTEYDANSRDHDKILK